MKPIRLCHLRTLEALPFVVAKRRGLFERHGLSVELTVADGWSAAKNLMISGHVVAAHMPLPLPIAVTLGVGGRRTPLRIALQLAAAGGALLVPERLGRVTPQHLAGRALAIPHRHSLTHSLVSHWLAAQGLNPLEDVTLTEVAPSRMGERLEAGRIDTAFATAPFAQEIAASGASVLVRSRDIWPGHPGDVLAVSQSLIDESPETVRALVEALVEAVRTLRPMDPDRAKVFAAELQSTMPTLGPERLARALVETPLGDPSVPRPAHLVWLMVQMQRWGTLVGDHDLGREAEAMVHTDDAKAVLGESTAQVLTPQIELADGTFDCSDHESARAALPFSVFDPLAEPTQHLYTDPETINSRIGEITDAMAEVGAGLPVEPLQITSTGPVGLLEQSFNEMVLNLRFAREEIEALQRTLERRVEERTAELREANEMLERLLHEDVLTGLPNRRRLTEHLTLEFRRARRHGVPLSVVMIDLDRFKSVNDTHGHQVGDSLLAHVAEVMQEGARGTDMLARYGGEEFCAVLSHTRRVGALQYAERLRAAIEASALPLEEGELKVTASLGVAELTDAMESESALVQAADEALYRAKETGRNRVVAAGEGD